MCAISLLLSWNAQAADLGAATPYNLFVLGNHSSSGSDIQGRVAVGGNATYSGYDIGSQAAPGDYVLVTGGSLSFMNGTIHDGGIVAGGNVNLQSLTVTGGNVVAGGTITFTNGTVNGALLQNQPNPVPVDFVGAAVSLTASSSYWGTLPVNGVTQNMWGTLYFRGSDPNLNVFTISGATFANCYGVNIQAPSGSTVLINIDGTSDAMPNTGYNISGTDRNHVVYNFYQATSLRIGQTQGIVFAPQAVTSFPWGVANGTVVVKSLSGGGQINAGLFTGNLPPVPPPGGGGGVILQ